MDFLFIAVDLSLFFFDGHTAFFEIGKKIFEVFIVFTDAGFGVFDEVFAKKDDIAKDVNATVSEQMAAYGFTLVSTLITKIALPTEVENSMNDINAAQRKRAAAQELAEADRIKRVTEATAEAEAMEKAGEGIANQRKAIALGIKDSLEIIQETGVGNDEANQLFMFTQWSEMMTEFARTGKTSTVVLPSDFSQSASMFEQMLTAGKVQNDSKE